MSIETLFFIIFCFTFGGLRISGARISPSLLIAAGWPFVLGWMLGKYAYREFLAEDRKFYEEIGYGG